MQKCNVYNQNGIKSAWLKRNENGGYVVRVCMCAKVFDDEVNSYLNLSKDLAINNSIKDDGKNISGKAGDCTKNPSALSKYKNISKVYSSVNPFSKVAVGTIKQLVRKNLTGIKDQVIFKNNKGYDPKNSKTGYLVFSNYRIENNINRNFVKYSYFYYDVSEEQKFVSEEVYRKFWESQNSDDTKELIRYFEKTDQQHPEFGMSVWIFEEGGEIKEIGISRVPRLLYRKSVDDAVCQKNHHASYLFDLPELIFYFIILRRNN